MEEIKTPLSLYLFLNLTDAIELFIADFFFIRKPSIMNRINNLMQNVYMIMGLYQGMNNSPVKK